MDFVSCNVLDVLKDAAQLLNHRPVCFHHINVYTTLHMRIHVLKYLVLWKSSSSLFIKHF